MSGPSERIGAAEAARRLGVSMQTLARWRKQGRLSFVRAWPGAHPQYYAAEVDALLADRRSRAES